MKRIGKGSYGIVYRDYDVLEEKLYARKDFVP